MIRRHVWMKVDISGDLWKAEDSVLFFIYTPVTTLSLASKHEGYKLPAIIIHTLSAALSAPYFLLSQLVLLYYTVSH